MQYLKTLIRLIPHCLLSRLANFIHWWTKILLQLIMIRSLSLLLIGPIYLVILLMKLRFRPLPLFLWSHAKCLIRLLILYNNWGGVATFMDTPEIQYKVFLQFCYLRWFLRTCLQNLVIIFKIFWNWVCVVIYFGAPYV